MSYIVPIFCLIFFIIFLELQLKTEVHNIIEEFRKLSDRITANKELININKESIENNKDNIDKIHQKISEINNESDPK